MKAEDTVMSELEEAQVLLNTTTWELRAGHSQYEIEKAQTRARKLAQAEISFRAGIREVVDTVMQLSPIIRAGQDLQTVAGNSNKEGAISYLMLELLDWLAKLKEWGMEKGGGDV